MERCNVCKKPPALERRVNNEGLVFCSDGCYETFDGSPHDHDHPYIDAYDAVRWAFIGCLNTYDPAGSKEQKRALQERIEAALEEFADFEGLGGEDGVFSREIYQYLMGLEELWDKIESVW